jgi:hypothetical protein
LLSPLALSTTRNGVIEAPIIRGRQYNGSNKKIIKEKLLRRPDTARERCRQNETKNLLRPESSVREAEGYATILSPTLPPVPGKPGKRRRIAFRTPCRSPDRNGMTRNEILL